MKRILFVLWVPIVTILQSVDTADASEFLKI